MKKILLFGGSGLIGSSIQELCPKHLQIVVPTHAQVDVTNLRQIKTCIFSFKPDVVVYSVAVSNPDVVEEKKDLAIQLNATSPGMIAKEAARYSVPMIYLSTDSVFSGGQKLKPYKEDDPVDPINFYGFTKRKGEEYVLKASSRNCVLRLITVYSHYYPRKMDIARLAVRSFQAGKSFTGIVDQYFNPTYVDDVSAAIFRIVEQEIRGVLHFGAADFMSNYAFVNTVASVCGFSDVEVKPVTLMEFYKAHKAKRGHFASLDTEKAKKLLGDSVVRPIRDGIQRFWHNYPHEQRRLS